MNNFDDLRKTEEFLNNYERWRKLMIKQAKRDLLSIISTLVMGAGMITTIVLTVVSMVLSLINLMNFLTLITDKTDIYSLFNQFKLFTFDNHFLTWIIPMSIWLLSYLVYRKTKSRTEPDIMKESLRLTAITMGLIKNKRNDLPTSSEGC